VARTNEAHEEGNTMSRLIAFAGRAGVGKSTAAAALEARGFVRVSFAAPLKRIAEELWELSDEQLFGDEKEILDPRWGCTPRHLLQQLGGRVRGIHEETWINAWRAHAAALLDRGVYVVTDDLRYPNELEAVLAEGGQAYLLERPGLEYPGVGHESETALVGYELPRAHPGEVFDPFWDVE
jgi:hypothetical protein